MTERVVTEQRLRAAFAVMTKMGIGFNPVREEELVARLVGLTDDEVHVEIARLKLEQVLGQ